MRIDLLLVSGEVPDSYIKGRRVVVVDVLRSCTSLVVALEAGADRIVPADSVEGAKQLLALLDRKATILAGEHEGRKVAGFDLGNSPEEFRDPAIAGKTVVFTSSNGAPLMARMTDAVEKLLLAFVNLSAVVDYLLWVGDGELTVACAGRGGRFGLEDAVCAGMLCERLAREKAPLELNDAGEAALGLARAYQGDLDALIRRCAAGRHLREIGMEADLNEASRIDSIPLVPVVREGRITGLRSPWTEA